MDDGDQGGWGKQEEALRPHCKSLCPLLFCLFACFVAVSCVALLLCCVAVSFVRLSPVAD